MDAIELVTRLVLLVGSIVAWGVLGFAMFMLCWSQVGDGTPENYAAQGPIDWLVRLLIIVLFVAWVGLTFAALYIAVDTISAFI